MYLRLILLSLLPLVLTACNSSIPQLIRQSPTPNPGLSEVKQTVSSYQNQNVRWGGKILSVENKQHSTLIEVLSHPLTSHGRPKQADDYQGRFMAELNGFIDPEHYQKDRYITVYGKVDKSFEKLIDEHPYEYTLVQAESHYLWPEYLVNPNFVPYGHYYADYPFVYGPRYFYGPQFFYQRRFLYRGGFFY